ncbi:MAG: outer membrane lipoprotein carrier protein LolA, partial [Pseudomonadota bacterium]
WIALCLSLSLGLAINSPANAAPPDIAASVKDRLAQPAVLRGEFEQSKQVAGFKKPLLSRGDFLLARNRGVVWLTRQPFASVLKLTQDEIVATQGGQVAFRLSASKEPTVRIINGVLFSLLNGDLSGLTEHFKIDGSIDGKEWKLSLTPKQAGLAKMMTRIELAGDRYVRRIDIDEANGDKTAIRFSAHNVEPASLRPDEVSQFE